MVVEGTQLPDILHDEATSLDVWRCDMGVALTLSTTNGRVYAGTRITYDEWLTIVAYVEASFISKKE